MVEHDTATKTYVIVGGGYWGKGNTVAEAKKQFRYQGGKLTGGYGIYTFDEQTVFHGIDSFGRYEYTGNAPALEVVKGRKS